MRKLVTRLAALPLCALALCCAAPASAQPSLLGGGSATPNFLGTTGLLLTPSAYTVGDRGISAHAYGHSNFQSYGVQLGITSRFEIGGTFLNGDDGRDDGILANAKFQLLKESFVLPAISVGVTDAFDELNVGSSWYAVASKDLSRTIPLGLFPVRAHLGFGGGLYDEEIFAGLEMNIGTPFSVLPIVRPTFSAMAEYQNGDVNLGLRGRFRGFSATVGLFDFSDFGAGIRYTTGLRLR